MGVISFVLVVVLPVLDLVPQRKLAGSSVVGGEGTVFDSGFGPIWAFLVHRHHVGMGTHLASGRSHLG